MADQKIADLTAIASIDGDEILYLVDDPGGTPLDRKVTVDDLLAAGSGSSFVGCRVRHSANQAIPTASVTVLAFDTDVTDTDAFHDQVTNNSRLTIPAGKAGRYRVSAMVAIEAGGSARILHLYKNGASHEQFESPGSAAGATTMILTDVLDLAVGDYVELAVFQNSGGSLNVRGHGSYALHPSFALEFLGT